MPRGGGVGRDYVKVFAMRFHEGKKGRSWEGLSCKKKPGRKAGSLSRELRETGP